MTRGVLAGRLAAAAAHVEDALAVHAPQLRDGFRAALPAAADTVGRRLRGALVREDVGDAHRRHAGHGRRYAFDRVEFAEAGTADPADLLRTDAPGFAAELRNAVVNLAVAAARGPTQAGGRPDDHGLDSRGPAGCGLGSRGRLQTGGRPAGRGGPDGGDGDGPDKHVIGLERLAVAGHNLHPCGRTRLGWDTADVLAHDLESGHTRVGFVAVRDDAHLGDDVGAMLRALYPHLDAAPPGYRLQPVHAWQRDRVLRSRYRDLLDDGVLRLLDAELPAVPTAALRTLLLPAGADGRRRYLKVSLDIQVTSTRRSISVASTRNGPALSALLHHLLAADPDGHRVLLLAETAGAAVPAGSGRDMSAILRDALPVLRDGETVVPGGALPQLAAGLVGGGDAGAWLRAYARLLLPPLLRLTAAGVALEAHLQNCLPTFVGGQPHRMIVRDFAGLRLHPPRLAAAGHHVTLWPGSVVATTDTAVLRAKIGYTALQAHLGEVIIRLGESHGLNEDAAWRSVRAVLDETYEPLRGDPHAAADHAAFTAPRVPHKALVRMRLTGGGERYLPVRNPLHASA